MIRAILFDLDDTLLNREASFEQFLRLQMQRLKLPLELQPHYAECVRVLDQGGKGDRQQMFSILQQEFFPGWHAGQLEDDFERHEWDSPVLYPGTYTALLQLRALGLKLGIVTNGSNKSQRAKMAFSKLSEYMDLVLVSEAVGLQKPDPQIFRMAVDQLAVVVKQCIFVGSHPEQDILGAQKAGLRAAWLHHGRLWEHARVQPDWRLESVSELVPLVSRRQPLEI